ncbi:MAG TPA: AI-2E family transporter [Ktedonobacteraceae bacterium]|nr:AI-2E family transporter [Ktedonobacteraceae bacterium]
MALQSPDFRRRKEEIINARWQRRRDIPLAILAWVAVGIIVLMALGYVTHTVIILIIAGLLAFALAPVVKFLARFMPRFLAILIVYLVILSGISFLIYMIISTAASQIGSLAANLQVLTTPGPHGQSTPLEAFLGRFGISQSQIASARTQIVGQIEGLAGSVVPLLAGVLNTVLDIIVVAIISIYLLVDGQRISRWLRTNMPTQQQGRVRFLLHMLERVVGGYIRGQLIMSTFIGIVVGVGMALFHVPYAVLLGVLAFVLEFIPVLGTLTSGAICVLIALTQGWLIAVLVLGYFVIVHIIEGDILGPRIVGKAVGLHPIVSLAALIAGAELFGIIGALLASPVAGIIQALIVAIWTEWKETHPDQFQQQKEVVEQSIDENLADKPLNPAEPTDKLLT